MILSLVWMTPVAPRLWVFCMICSCPLLLCFHALGHTVQDKVGTTALDEYVPSAAFLIGDSIKVRPKIKWYGSLIQFFFSLPLRNAALVCSRVPFSWSLLDGWMSVANIILRFLILCEMCAFWKEYTLHYLLSSIVLPAILCFTRKHSEGCCSSHQRSC